MVAQAEVDAVLIVCGIVNAEHRQRLVAGEGFTTLEMFGIMDGDQDVVDMAKRLAGRPAASRVNLGTIQIKALQALVWWVHDRQTHGQPLVGAEFTQAALTAARQQKRIDKEKSETDASVSSLVKFDPDIFEVCDDTFRNFLNAINYHAVREAVAANILRVAKEDGETNLADLLTKVLTGKRRWDLCFHLFR